MRTSPALAGIAAVVILLSVAGSILLSADSKKDGGGSYQLAVPLEAVMEVMGDVYKAMPDLVKAGTDKDLRALKQKALFIAEIGNLAGQLKERAGVKDWKGWADSLKTTGLAMAEAAGRKDTSKFESGYKKFTDTCKACHDKYRDE